MRFNELHGKHTLRRGRHERPQPHALLRTLSVSLAIMLLLVILSAAALPAQTAGAVASPEAFQPGVTYTPSLTPAERTAIHAQVDAIAGDVGDAAVGDGSYNPLTLVGTMLDGSSYDSISRGGTAATAYPFPISNTSGNQYEYDRKVAKLAWVTQVATDLGFPVVVHRQPDKVVYVEIGDPNAPEMVMALSHLDSPTGSVGSGANLERWRGPDGLYHVNQYKTPYVKNGWIYGAGIQDDSGPTLATLYAAKAMMEAGVPMDRRVRIVMGCYEDGGPGTPSVANTTNFMSIPYYTANPGFYDNWAYKYLNREETPIAGYTSDSRFPVIVGNSGSVTPTVSMSLAGDAGKAFRLSAATAGVTLREGDPTLKDITHGSTTQMASRAIFTLDVTAVNAAGRNSFIGDVNAAATARGWLPAPAGTTPKVQAQISGNNIILEINTDVAMEMPTPQYGKNAIVWGMYLISDALEKQGVTATGLQLKRAAEGITDLFFRGCEEGEAYIGKNMGIPENLLRNPDNGCPNFTFALMGGLGGSTAASAENLVSFYSSNSLSIPMQIRSMHVNATNSGAAAAAVTSAFQAKGFTIGSIGSPIGAGLYLSHDNPLTALQFASYKATMEHDPAAFEDVYGLLGIAYPQGTTGGTLAGNFQNKMTAFGATIPGNERWWHTANERMKVQSAIEMTKLMADGMQEMARYSGPAGAQYMWADIPGLNADRADLDLLDVTVGTYQDASGAVLPQYLGKDALLAATKFDIPMWSGRGNSSPSAAAYAAGHGSGGVYLPLNNADFLANTFVLPMRLEFKVQKGNISATEWEELVNGGYESLSFNLLRGGAAVPLKVAAGQDAQKFFSTRVSLYDPDTLYICVNLAIKDAPYDGVTSILADSKTDLYALNPAYAASNPNPFPERGAKEQRGFFLFGDGSKDARFISPEAIYVSTVFKSALNTLIAQAQSIFDDATVGKGYGQYTQEAKDDFSAAIAVAQGVADNDAAAQLEVDSAVIVLQAAIDTFQNAANPVSYCYDVYMQPSKSQLFVGETFSVDVMLTGDSNYTSLTADVSYDPALLKCEGYSNMTGFVTACAPTGPGTIGIRLIPSTNMVLGVPSFPAVKVVTLQFTVLNTFAGSQTATALNFSTVQVNPPAGYLLTGASADKPAELDIYRVGNEYMQENLAKFPEMFDVAKNQTKPAFSNDTARVIQEEVWVEVPCDTDKDGKRDLIRVRFRRPIETRTGGLKTPVIAQLTPYTGTNGTLSGPLGGKVDTDYPGANNPDTRNVNYADLRYDGPRYKDLLAKNFEDLSAYGIPAARVPVGSQREGAATANWSPTTWHAYFIPLGYTCASVEILGCTYAEGILTYGGYEENLAAAALVDWLNGRIKGYTSPTSLIEVEAPYWATGEVAMSGTSYGGQLPFGAAVTGVEGLRTIVPFAAPTSSYEYYRANGGVYAPGAYQGEDVSEIVAYCFGRGWAGTTTPTSPVAPSQQVWERFYEYVGECYEGQDRTTGDYNAFWDARNIVSFGEDARKDLGIIIFHGLNDDNVKFKNGALMYDMAQRYGITAKAIFHQGNHTSGQNHNGLNFYPDVHKWFDYYLFGVTNGMPGDFPDTRVQSNVDISWKEYATWPAGEYQKFYPAGNERVGTLTTAAPASGSGLKFKDDFILGLTRPNYTSPTYTLPTPKPWDTLYTLNAEKYRGHAGNDMAGSQYYRWRSYMLGGADSTTTWGAHWTAPATGVYDLAKPLGDRLLYVLDVSEEMTISGTIKMTAKVAADKKVGSISAMLVDYGSERRYGTNTATSGNVVAPDGTTVNLVSWSQGASATPLRIVSRGLVDVQNPNWDGKIWSDCRATNWMAPYTYQTTAITPGTYYPYTWELDVTNYTVLAGHKLVLILFGSDPEYTIRPYDPTEFTVETGPDTYLSLPLVAPYIGPTPAPLPEEIVELEKITEIVESLDTVQIDEAAGDALEIEVLKQSHN